MLAIQTEGRPVQLVTDRVFIKANKEGRGEYKSKYIHLIIDTDFDETSTENAIQDGIIKAIPRNSKLGMKVGDHVYTSHFLMEKEYQLTVDGEQVVALGETDVYCKVKDKKITMFGEWNLIEPIKDLDKETASGIIYELGKGNVALRGKLLHTNPKLEALGVKIGNIIAYTAVADYEILIEGKYYFRMLNEDVCAIIGESEL